ncbi:MAG: NmrA family NAD(P)-binding protein [Ktedonobacterales bacterium]|nr:NmrA family NAD(P)-binding protein [Ktedonobacterales bacterium]
MLIVTGANGHLGRAVVEHLLELVPAERLGVSVQDTEKARDLEQRGVRVRRGDFDDAASLAHAFEGASRVLVVSVDKLGEEGVAQSKAAIEAAYRAGADRVLYTSHQAANRASSFAPARDHAAVEAYLEACGQPFTSLRNGYYTSSLAFHIGNAAQTGELAAPADGPVSWTTRANLAEAAAAILVGDNPFDGPTPPLPAARAVDMQEVAEILSEVTGRTVRRVVVEDDDFIAHLTGRGIPAPFARLFIGTYQAARDGEFAVTDLALGRLIGRPPTPVRDALRAEITPAR